MKEDIAFSKRPLFFKSFPADQVGPDTKAMWLLSLGRIFQILCTLMLKESYRAGAIIFFSFGKRLSIEYRWK